MYYKDENDTKDRRKIITVATAATAIILILVAAIIVVATKKSGNTEQTAVNGSYVEETSEKTEETKNEVEWTPVEMPTPTETSTVTETSDEMPEAGPTDMLPLAILFGAVAMFATSTAVSKR